MSRFYASIQGHRGKATRQGHNEITGHIRGWQSGVRVDGFDAHGLDAFKIFVTSGSGSGGWDKLIGTVVDGQFVPKQESA